MKPQSQRILAAIGLVLICASIVLMLVGFFAGSAKNLLLNLSLYSFLGSVAVVLFLSYKRKQVEQDEDADNE